MSKIWEAKSYAKTLSYIWQAKCKNLTSFNSKPNTNQNHGLLNHWHGNFGSKPILKTKEKYRAFKFGFDPLGIWIMGHLWGTNGHLNATVFRWSN